MVRVLKALMWTMGVACIAIGLFHLALGIDSVPGEATVGATVDSRERFYGAVFIGYGAAWIAAVRQSPVRRIHVWWLAGIFLVGGLGRVLSMAVHGQPHWFQVVLTVVELVLPPIFLFLAGADEQRSGGRVMPGRSVPSPSSGGEPADQRRTR